MPRSDERPALSEIALLVLFSRFDSSQPLTRLNALNELSKLLPSQSRAAVIGLPDSDKIPLREGGLFYFEEDFEQEAFLKGVNNDAFKTAGDWYKSEEIAKILESEGFQPAALIQHPLTYFLLAFLRDTALINGLLDHLDPGSVYFFQNGVFKKASTCGLKDCLGHLWPPERDEIKTAPFTLVKGLKEMALKGCWRILTACLGFLSKARNRQVLICSDLKHCETVIPTLFKNPELRLILLRQKAGVRFWRFALQHSMGVKFLNIPSVADENENLWALLDTALSRSAVFNRNGVNLWPFMRPSFRVRLFCKIQPLSALYAQALRFFRKESPAGLLFDEDVTPYNKTLALAARKLQIPSLVIQHGAPFRTVPIALAPVTASKIAAWGPYSRELLQSWGVPDSQITLTGVPRYDGFEQALNRQSAARKKVFHDLSAAPEFKLVVLATDPFHEDGRADFVGHYLSRENTGRLLDTVFSAVKALNDTFLVVKLHPRDPHEEYSKKRILNSGLQDRVKLVRLYSTQDLLLACDVLITPCSTVAIEAMMLRKPVITVNLEGGRDLQPHAETGAAVGAKSLESLHLAVDRLLHDNLFREEQIERALQVIPRYLSRPERGASKRTAEVLLELIEANSGGCPK